MTLFLVLLERVIELEKLADPSPFTEKFTLQFIPQIATDV
jgi:hypothetical protein